jgi:hypothetical protein
LITGCYSGQKTDSNQPITSTPFAGQSDQLLITPTMAKAQATTSSSSTLTITPDNNINIRSGYELQIKIDYDTHSVIAQERIIYLNSTGVALAWIPVVIPPNHYKNVFQIQNINATPAGSFQFSKENSMVGVITLDDPLPAGSDIQINIQFTLLMPEQQAPFGYTAKQLNLNNWYPFVPPYKASNGWVMHEFSSIGEYLVKEKSDYSATITTTENQALVIAATGSQVLGDDGLIYSHDNARDFSLSVSPLFTMKSQTIGNTIINAYLFPEDEAAGNELIRNTASALVYYESLFDMKYPHAVINIVEADFQDGMESDGMYFLSQEYIKGFDGTPRNYMTILSAHETAHQWFYGVVGNDQAIEPWLDESLCTLSEILFIEEFYPGDSDWWWNYRVDKYAPQGNVNRTVYETGSLRDYINAVYLRGVRFLQELRSSTGDEYFITAIRNYLLKNKDQIATSSDFLEQFEPFDLSLLMSTYFSK